MTVRTLWPCILLAFAAACTSPPPPRPFDRSAIPPPPPAAPKKRPAASVAMASTQPPIAPSSDGADLPDQAGPFRELPPASFRSARPTVRKTRLEHASGVGVHFASDGSTYFTDAKKGRTEGGFLVTAAHPHGVFIGVSQVHQIEYAPDLKHIGILNDETASVLIHDIPNGNEVSWAKGASLFRFLDNTTVAYRSACQLHHLTIESSQPPTPVGAKNCGSADASDDGKSWIIVTPGRHGTILSMRDYTRLQWMDGQTGAITQDIPFPSGILDPRISPLGGRSCFYSRAHQGIACIRRASSNPVLVAKDTAAFPVMYNERGDQFLYRSDKWVWLADLRAWTVRRLFPLKDARYSGFLPGGTRLYAYNRGLVIYDLPSMTALQVLPTSLEVGGIGGVPGRPNRITIGEEVGGGRVMYFVDFTPP